MYSNNENIHLILEKSRTRFLERFDIANLLRSILKFPKTEFPEIQKLESLPNRPKPGLIFMIELFSNKEKWPNFWKKDGYEYVKRRNGGIKEFKQIMKMKEFDMPNILVSYSDISKDNQQNPENYQILQRRIYSICNMPTFKMVHYNYSFKKRNKEIKINKNEDTYFLNSILIGKTETVAKQFKNKCVITHISPKTCFISGGENMLIVLSEKLKRDFWENINVLFGKNKAPAKLLNPYTLKVKIPSCEKEMKILPEIILENGLFIRNSKSYFEYTGNFFEELTKDINEMFESESSINLSHENEIISPGNEELGPDESEKNLEINKNDPLLFFENLEIEKEIEEENVFEFLDKKFENVDFYFENARIIQKNVKGWISRRRYRKLKQAVLNLQRKFKNASKKKIEKIKLN